MTIRYAQKTRTESSKFSNLTISWLVDSVFFSCFVGCGFSNAFGDCWC